MRTSVKLRDLFSSQDRVLVEYAWLEEYVGAMVPVEVVVHFPLSSQIDFRQQALFVNAVATEVRKLDEVGGVMSAATFALPFPQDRGARQIVRKTMVRNRLQEARFLCEDEARRSWRVTARVPALGDLDYQQFLQQLEHRITPLIATLAERAREPIEATVTGALPLIYQTQRTLLADLINS